MGITFFQTFIYKCILPFLTHSLHTLIGLMKAFLGYFFRAKIRTTAAFPA
ncbi:MAG: hypothetical protein RLZZ420_2327 [Bacteroidota bacterium]